MLKNNKKLLLITSIFILLPIVAGLLLWNRLPDQIPTHWNAMGEADGYSSRGIAVFGIPLFLLAIHWLCLFATKSDKNNVNQSEKIQKLTMWICPVISFIGAAAIYGTALGLPVNMPTFPCMLLGSLFLIIGNYLPKCKHNYTIGIRLPWTLASEENWNATHRFAGKVWVIGSILIYLMVLLPDGWIFPAMFAVILPLVIIPTVYSYLYHRNHTTE